MKRGGFTQRWIRPVVLACARVIGTMVIDQETGRPLGKALLLPWRGKILVIGLDARVRPFFLPQARLTYWKQELGFTVHPAVDYPNERGASRDKPER